MGNGCSFPIRDNEINGGNSIRVKNSIRIVYRVMFDGFIADMTNVEDVYIVAFKSNVRGDSIFFCPITCIQGWIGFIPDEKTDNKTT